jgi:hypothetical protein
MLKIGSTICPDNVLFTPAFPFHNSLGLLESGGHRGRDRMVVAFTTTCAISAYHH